MEYVVDYYDWRNRHGLPQGYHYTPMPLELIDLLGDKLAGRPLPEPLPSIFTDVRILDLNPDDLHEQYMEREEAGYVYFFSEREFASKRPTRRTANGCWKRSRGSKPVNDDGGVDVGQQCTMVFRENRFPGDKHPAKTDWAMHEFAKIIGPDKKLANMAIYRLYKMRSRKAQAEAGRCLGGAAAAVVVADKATMHDEPHQPPEPVVLCLPPSTQLPQQQLGEQASCPKHENSARQLLKNDLPPPSPSSAVPLPEEDPSFAMIDEQRQLCTFIIDELLGTMDDWAPVTMVAHEADTNNQVQHSTQLQQ